MTKPNSANQKTPTWTVEDMLEFAELFSSGKKRRAAVLDRWIKENEKPKQKARVRSPR